MTVADILTQTRLATLDAEVLLAHALNVTREWLITHNEYEPTECQLHDWQAYEQRRQHHEPVAYITGQKEFYGRNFIVTPDVLIPRPATEGLVDAVLHTLRTQESSRIETDTDIVAGCKLFRSFEQPPLIVEIGTGSGCIAISLKLENPELRIVASDISEAALQVARQNAKAHQADISFVLSDGPAVLEQVSESFLLVSNPPYIPETEVLPRSVEAYEPATALFSGTQGTNLLQAITTAAKARQDCVGICYECKASQWEEVEKWT